MRDYPIQATCRITGGDTMLLSFFEKGEEPIVVSIVCPTDDELDYMLVRTAEVIRQAQRRRGLLCICGGDTDLEYDDGRGVWGHRGCLADYGADRYEEMDRG